MYMCNMPAVKPSSGWSRRSNWQPIMDLGELVSTQLARSSRST